jgi:hypothetical protein
MMRDSKRTTTTAYIYGIELKLRAFFISAFNGGEWSDSHFSLSSNKKLWVERFGNFRIILKLNPKRF